jgi:NAD(P)-dependent dehydrogenase (short-subunit alcohol dehydrogenase family)
MTGVSGEAADKRYWRPVPAVKPNERRVEETMLGKTALITGASSGIGAELARLHSARRGDLVLVARRTEALDALKVELERAHGINATVITADLAQPDAAEKVFKTTEAAGLQIDILINNAGFGGHGKFHERDLAKDQAMLQGVLVKINEPKLNVALNWVIPLLPRKPVLKMSRKTMEKT